MRGHESKGAPRNRRNLPAVLAIVWAFVTLPAFAQVSSHERAALVSLYNSTGGPNWSNKAGWLGVAGTECRWYGVTCARPYGFDTVLALELGGNNLSGSLPSELETFTYLETLALDGNRIGGSIPTSIANLSHLRTLSLSRNQLSGSIPEALGIRMWRLEVLSLSYNQLSGEIPPVPTDLVRLELDHNQLSGPPPIFSYMPGLVRLTLGGNNLVGELEPWLATALPSVCVGCLSLEYNGISARDPEADAWATARQPNWKTTQTIDAHPQFREVTTTTARIDWDPIAYSLDRGSYDAYLDSGSGPYLAASTSDKTATGLTLTGLQPGTSYTLTLRTVTHPHARNPSNEVVSEGWPHRFVTQKRTFLAIGDATVSEASGGTVASFPVSLSESVFNPVSVHYTTVRGTTNTHWTDHSEPSGSVHFLNGATTATIQVAVRDDANDEPDEVFHVELSAPKYAEIEDGDATGTIIDDDAPAAASVDDMLLIEDLHASQVVDALIRIAPASGWPVSVDWATASGTAVASSDFFLETGTVTFAPGETQKKIFFWVYGDREPEMTESFFLRLGNFDHASAGDAEGEITIIDGSAPRILVSDVSAFETADATAAAIFSIRLSVPSIYPVSVDWQTADGSASLGRDYLGGGSGTISFAPGETDHPLTFPLVNDDAGEGNETFRLTLSGAVQASIPDGVAFATIFDDDRPANLLDPMITVEGCFEVGLPCTLTVTSKSGQSAGEWTLAWSVNGDVKSKDPVWRPEFTKAGPYHVNLSASSPVGTGEAEVDLILVPSSQEPCPDGSLCMLSKRFHVELVARDHRTGATGAGRPLQQNDLFGYFSLPSLTGNADNPEVFVKLLDGRAVNGNFWTFYGGLTDLEYSLKVTDSVTGASKSYSKAGGSASGGFDVGSGATPESCVGEIDGILLPPAAPGSCDAGDERLCLNGGRFLVRVDARDQRTGATDVGRAIPQSPLFGYFALPSLTGSSTNPEIFVKVLDGRAINGSFWIFFSGLTDLEYTVTVVDTINGVTKKYTKEAGSACGAFDTDAF